MITGNEMYHALITNSELNKGITIRQYFAGQAMAAFISRPMQLPKDDTYQTVAQISIEMADALISELNKEK